MQSRKFAFALGAVLVIFIGCGGGSKTTSTPPTSPSPTATKLAVTTTSLAAGTVGTAYSATLAAMGGTTPYHWSIPSGDGSLPSGLQLSDAGVISGTPTAVASSIFTVQVRDSASTPQTATASLSLQINAVAVTLKITTTSLPAGTIGTPYDATLAASGGVPPYTWSISQNQLPAGLSLAAPTGIISGTPTALANDFPYFTVTDSAQHAVTQSLQIIINPAQTSLPNGNYSFVFGGTVSQSSVGLAINGTFSLANGTVTGGIYDENAQPSAPVTEQKITGGTVTAYASGLGQFSLTLASGNVTFAFASPTSFGSANSTSEIRIIEYDDTNGMGTRGSGVLKLAQVSTSASAIQGNYAFHFSGIDASEKQAALVGSFHTDGNGNITSGTADMNDDGTVLNVRPITGAYAIDDQGRGTLKLVFNGTTTFNYSFYQASPSELLAVSTDQASANIPVVIGSLLRERAPFANALLNGTYVIELAGLAHAQGGVTPDVTLGLATADGKGNLTISADEYALNPTSPSYSGTYAVEAATGRVVFTTSAGTPLIFYLVDTTQAFALATDSSSSSGILESQSGAPFANASFSGTYLGGTLALSDPSIANLVGIVATDGGGNVIVTSNTSSRTGLSLYDKLTANYVADTSGRVVVTAADGVTRIFYIVAPTKVALLAGGGTEGVYTASFEQ